MQEETPHRVGAPSDLLPRQSLSAPSAREKPGPTAAVRVPQIALADEAAAAVHRRVVFSVGGSAPVVPAAAQSLLPACPNKDRHLRY